MPANCTDKLQPMDLSVNKAAKDFIRQKFREWYSEKVFEQLDGEEEVEPLKLNAAAMKTVGAKWLVQMFEYFQDNPQIITNSFIKAGIPQALDSYIASVATEESEHEDVANNNNID